MASMKDIPALDPPMPQKYTGATRTVLRDLQIRKGTRLEGDPTHALLSGQSQSIRDNVMALFGAIRAWNCSAANLARTGRISAMWNRIPIERCPGQVGVCYPLDC
jgi:hypothetical protein